ncbi:MAG: hypothetical protein LIP11_06075 [Clostridiales bacterium]|nr:hypothetical protein [Clostridiales bacterium]
MELAMETPLVLFHGHSRYEAMEQFGIQPDGIALFPARKKRKKPAKTTAPADLSPELQLELYDLYYEDDPDPEDYDQFMKKIGCANYAVRYLKIQERILLDDFIQAEAEAKLLIKESGHQEFHTLLDEIRESRELEAEGYGEEDSFSESEIEALIDELFRHPH